MRSSLWLSQEVVGALMGLLKGGVPSPKGCSVQSLAGSDGTIVRSISNMHKVAN